MHEAELGLRAVSAQTDMKVGVIRPPVVHVSDAPDYLGLLMRRLKRGASASKFNSQPP